MALYKFRIIINLLLVSSHHIVIILALRYMCVHRGVRLRPTTNHRLRLY